MATTLFLSTEELLDKGKEIVRLDKSHRDYKRTVAHAKWCYETMTGNQSKEVVISYRLKENEEQKKQRFKLYNSRTQEVAYNIEKLFNEVHRSDSVIDEIRYTEANEDGLNQLKGILSTFNGPQSLDKYLPHQFKYLNFHDPNSWLLLRFDTVDGEQRSWPEIVSSDNAFNWEEKYGYTQYLIVRTRVRYEKKATGSTKISEKQVVENHKAKEAGQDIGDPYGGVYGYTYTLYAPQVIYEWREIPPGAVAPVPDGYISEEIDIVRMGSKKKATFYFGEFRNELEELFAQRIGYFKDPETKQRTFVSPLYPATKVLDDLIVRKMAYDISHALHGYFKEFVYVQKCKECNGKGKKRTAEPLRESGGRREYGEVVCGKCNGVGDLTHSGDQDVVKISLPDEITDIVPLRDLIYYAEIPEQVFIFQEKDVEKAKRDAYGVIFNGELFDRTQVATTATEHKLNWRSVYNALQDYAERYSDLYEWAIYTTANIHTLNPDDNLVVEHAISSDFRLETIDELVERGKSLQGGPVEIAQHNNAAIMALQHKGSPENLQRYEAKQQFKPFRDKSPTELAIVIGQLAGQKHPLYITWIYFEDIFKEIEVRRADWWTLPYKDLRVLFNTVAAEFIAREEEGSSTPPSTFESSLSSARTNGLEDASNSQDDNSGEQAESDGEGASSEETP